MLDVLEPLAHRTGLEVLCEDQDFRWYHSDQPTVFSGAYIITVLRYGYRWLILQLYGCSGPTVPSEILFFVQNLEPSAQTPLAFRLRISLETFSSEVLLHYNGGNLNDTTSGRS